MHHVCPRRNRPTRIFKHGKRNYNSELLHHKPRMASAFTVLNAKGGTCAGFSCLGLSGRGGGIGGFLAESISEKRNCCMACQQTVDSRMVP